jgi:hypothetical protein
MARLGPHLTRETIDVPGVGTVEVHYDLAEADGAFVTYETHYRFGPDDVSVGRDTLRFMSREELAAFLAEAGFFDATWFGDWDRSPLTAASPEFVVIAG